MEDNENKTTEEEEIDLSEATVTGNENKDIYNEIKAKISAEKAKKIPFLQSVYDWLETFGLAVSLMIVVFLLVFKYVTVDGSSMLDTLTNGDKLIISSVASYDNGDIVVICQPDDERPLVKRIIAKGGQTVEIDFENWIVYVDGVALDEPYVRRVTKAAMRRDNFTDTITVPDGYVFVMGDNRNGSSDSRSFGCIDERNILGEVVFRLFPLDVFGTIE